ncbi:NAD+ synthase [Saliphagus sp. LR7]|uniref:NAD+ synthase n=1 Tax=Saliphagus sp. LR7 TaxID=2282654 RepID=UPI000DF75181|nr:NAD+ synthase [Saliphagus sp. LR7]
MLDLRFSEAELETRREHVTGFIRETADAAGADGAVLGLSGGIDSTLTAYLAAEALGADALHGLVMPGTVSDDDNMSDAERVAMDLELSYDIIEIEPIVGSLLSAYPEAEGDQVAVGNARARVRAVLNYLVANHDDRLVLGTGNRSEAAVGYFTKYGDGAVDCHPIGNLYKRQVRQLARHVGVPDDLAEKTPTAGLWEGQTDEAELGLDYDTLDSILALHIDGPLSAAATRRELGVDREAIETVRGLYERSAHKRAAPPAPDPLP